MFFDGSSSSRKEVNLGGKRKGLTANAKDKASFVEQVFNTFLFPIPSPSPLSGFTSFPSFRSRPCALSAKPSAAAKTGLIPLNVSIFTPSSSPFISVFSSASKLAATWRAFADRRALRSNLEQKRRACADGFAAMPSPSALCSCVQLLSATHRQCSPL